MPLPSNMSTVWIRGKFVELDGDAAKGAVTFTPSTKVLVNVDGAVIVVGVPFSAALDNTGAFAVRLPCTDDPDATPTGWTYTVTEPGTGRTYPISVPIATPVLNSPGDPLHGQRVLDLHRITPAAAANGGTVVVLVPEVDTDDVAGAVGAYLLANPPPAGFSPLEFRHDAGLRPDGLLVDGSIADSGQLMRSTSTDATAAPRYLGGQITSTETIAPAAGYVMAQLQQSVRMVGARFTVRDLYSTPNGVAALGAFSAFPPFGTLSPLHLGVGSRRWEFAVFVPNGQGVPTYTVIDSGEWATPLVDDGATTYAVELHVDQHSGRAIVFLPDGSVRGYSHAGFRQAARWPFFEPYRLQSGDQHVGFRYVYATSTDQSLFARAEALLRAYVLGTTARAEAASALAAAGAGAGAPAMRSTQFTNGTSTLYVPSTLNVPTDVVPGGVQVACQVGASGKARVTWQFFVESTVNAYYLATCAPDGAGSPPAVTQVLTVGTPKSDTVQVEFLMTGLAAGVRTFRLQHWEFDTGRPLVDADPGIRVNEPLGQRITGFAVGVE